MSDTVLVALIAWATALTVPVVTHLLARRDRALASRAVHLKTRELQKLKAHHARELQDARDEIASLRRQLLERGVTP